MLSLTRWTPLPSAMASLETTPIRDDGRERGKLVSPPNTKHKARRVSVAPQDFAGVHLLEVESHASSNCVSVFLPHRHPFLRVAVFPACVAFLLSYSIPAV